MTLQTRYVPIMVTRRCNMTCAHCSVESSPRVKGDPSVEELVGWIRQAAAAGVRLIRLTGGEPMLREAVVLRLLEECRALGVRSAITTNGFWGRSRADANRRVKRLVRAGLNSLTVSVDRFHAEFQDLGPAMHIAAAAESAALATAINFVRGAEDEELTALAAPFQGLRHVHLRFYTMQAVGRARDLPVSAFSGEVGGFCSAAGAPAIADDGRLIACNGPSYFEAPGSPLIVGSLHDTPLQTLLERHLEDPVLDTIRTGGPARLRDELKNTAGFETFPFRERYSGMCDLCHHITSNPDAVTALRQRLAAPTFVAERRAIQRVIAGARDGGVLSWAHVNGAGFSRAIAQVARDGRPSGETERVLRRADLDWSHRAHYLIGCGMARVALDAIRSSDVEAWAPHPFVDILNKAAIQEGIRELVQRDALRRVDDALVEMGATGVLLKGAALPSFAVDGASGLARRAAGDIDLYVAPRVGSALRTSLLAHGFRGVQHSDRTAPHHLAPITFSGVPLEIHERIMPAFWGLPEREMLARTKPFPEGRALATLDAEGCVLHAGMHASTHLFAFGLKTGWDMLWLLQQHPDLDWDRIARWIAAARVPRAFWAPVSVLARELAIPIPESFLERAPSDARQRDLETIAKRLLFFSTDRAFDLNPFSRNAVVLLMHDSWPGRARYVAGLLGQDARDARREAVRHASSQSWRQVPAHMREAWRQWGQFQLARRINARTNGAPMPE